MLIVQLGGALAPLSFRVAPVALAETEQRGPMPMAGAPVGTTQAQWTQIQDSYSAQLCRELIAVLEESP